MTIFPFFLRLSLIHPSVPPSSIRPSLFFNPTAHYVILQDKEIGHKYTNK